MPKVTRTARGKVNTCNTTLRVSCRRKFLIPGAGQVLIPAGCTREWPGQQPSLPCSSQGYFLCFFFFFFLGALLAFPECLGLLLEG